VSEPDYFGEVPSGRRLTQPARDDVARMHVLQEATDEAVAVCRRQWTQADPEDFDWSGRKVIDRASGEAYRISTAYPFAGEPAPSVVCFVVRDGRIVPLSKPGAEVVTTKTVEYGQVTGRRATGRERYSTDPVIR